MAFKALQDCETVILALARECLCAGISWPGPGLFQMIAELLVGR